MMKFKKIYPILVFAIIWYIFNYKLIQNMTSDINIDNILQEVNTSYAGYFYFTIFCTVYTFLLLAYIEVCTRPLMEQEIVRKGKSRFIKNHLVHIHIYTIEYTVMYVGVNYIGNLFLCYGEFWNDVFYNRAFLISALNIWTYYAVVVSVYALILLLTHFSRSAFFITGCIFSTVVGLYTIFNLDIMIFNECAMDDLFNGKVYYSTIAIMIRNVAYMLIFNVISVVIFKKEDIIVKREE